MSPARPTTLRIAAALILDSEGHMLLVRKRGTERFMQAGGKLEPGEPARWRCLKDRILLRSG
ncbi:hypothetical protein HNO52_17845 [Billgrantia diversa]|uniref:hypothetical protein n=1 Tax=Halomonas sp. MCCC 1A13316 TaxID=2733487 RepID=UPI0018A427BD|nr:hypothetical protein [Halomonas sp. MCCC 1A13316]QOR37060.1 hypothetical protein HNO52_17845 [Halomonas sp. MCCC 1A13316]